MKKIILVSNKVMHYRVSIYNYLYVRFREQGYELIVITNSLQKDCPYKPQFRLIEVSSSFKEYRNLIRFIGPEVVVFFLHLKDWIMFPLMIWLKFTKTKSIYWNHGVNLADADNRAKYIFYNLAHSLANAIVLYSKRELRYIQPKNLSKVFVAPNALNFHDFPDVPESKKEIRERLKIPYHRVVLFVGRVLPYRRIDDLLYAVSYLRKGTGVVLVGSGFSEVQHELIESEERITYLGEIYDPYEVNSIFKMADVFGNPGAVGLAINQAFYWGLPIVVEDVDHGPEIMYLKPGINGHIVELGDVEEFARKINYVLNEDQYMSYSEAARNEILQHGAIENMAAGFIEAVEFVDVVD
jgi:glycosyltransferase involved in cell wall biosynthesis